jgi:hypothetical protein
MYNSAAEDSLLNDCPSSHILHTTSLEMHIYDQGLYMSRMLVPQLFS